MWPASMFAKSLTLSEIRRMNWPRISSGTISASSGFGASGIQLLKYAPARSSGCPRRA